MKTNPIIFIKPVKMKSDHSEWVTSKGKSIPLEEMSTTHIINSIKKIKASGGSWRADWLPFLEEELGKRNMMVTSQDLDDRLIKENEMIYFLSTSCDIQTISGKDEINSDLLYFENCTNKDIEVVKGYLKSNFSIPVDKDKYEFIKELKNDSTIMNPSEFYKKYESYKLENVFEKEWKTFIDIMLGRRKEDNE